MAAFLDQAGGLWARGALTGKIGSAFSATVSQHGGQETTLFSLIANMLHFSIMIVGLPYSFAGQTQILEVEGGTPYGATTITGADGARMPSALELWKPRYFRDAMSPRRRAEGDLAEGINGILLPAMRKAAACKKPAHFGRRSLMTRRYTARSSSVLPPLPIFRR